MLCAIWYHLYNLKNVNNTHGGFSLVFFIFFKLYKWYQIAQSITCNKKHDNVKQGTTSWHQPVTYARKASEASEIIIHDFLNVKEMITMRHSVIERIIIIKINTNVEIPHYERS